MLNVSEGVRKALILIPTQPPLLAKARVALRRKHLAHPEPVLRASMLAGPGCCRNGTCS